MAIPEDHGARPSTSVAGEPLTRRQVLVAGGTGAAALAFGGVLAGCGNERERVDLTVRAMSTEADFAGRPARTSTYGGQLPGRELRLKQGEPVRIRLVNELKEPTTIHWHGIRVQNDADGVPGFTQKPVGAGEEFVYAFTPPDAGTYFFHTHVGVQLDRGLYAPLIVEPRRESLAYDREAVIMFDDWLDGLAGTPERRLAQLRANGMDMDAMETGSGSAMNGMGAMGTRSRGRSRHTSLDGRAPGPDSLARLANELEAGRLDPGDVRDYPLYLANGRPPDDPARITVRKGDRLRLRLINPSADTIFCVFVERHELEVVHADGLAVRPVRTDAVILGMGERYDAMLQASGDGVARIVAVALGKRGRAIALLRYTDATTRAPAPDSPVRMPRRVLSYSDLRAADDDGSARSGDAPRVVRLDLGMRDAGYVWTIGRQAFPNADPIRIRRGERVRFVMRNRTMMPHPMHLHGHSFSVGGAGGPLKDTALALPMRELALDWTADNPGSWAYHCHNVYHQEAGMMRRIEVA
jgi:FtsP/CotA-like multicopper oxidase with cupredoxin domain